MKIQTEKKANEIINLVNDDHTASNPMLTSKIEEKEAPDNGFTLVKSRRKVRTHKIGSGEGDENFQGNGKSEKKSGCFY